MTRARSRPNADGDHVCDASPGETEALLVDRRVDDRLDYDDLRLEGVRPGRHRIGAFEVQLADSPRSGRRGTTASIHCSFFVNVFDDDMLVLSYAGNHPRNATVDRLKSPFLRRFRLARETPNALRELAAAYEKIRPPAGEKSWLVSRKDVAAQLEQLAQSLEEFLRSGPTH